uniref:Secreted protein n=1 Tax=Jahnella sp. MSr9139 TaxID=1434086 RepID=A0A4Y5T0H3_9BACT|nr:secreted protein [Jahnella sp. MSr9139]
MAKPVRIRTALLLASLLLPACSSSAYVQQGPSDALRAYARALQEGRVEDAYRLLSDEARRSMSLEAFRRAVKENPEDVMEIARAIARPSTDPVVTATVTVPNGEEILLVFEGGKWRIDAAAVDLYGQATPRQALLGFLRAFERKRYDVIMRYVPDAEKEGLAGGRGAAAASEEAPPPALPSSVAAAGTAGKDGPAGDASAAGAGAGAGAAGAGGPAAPGRAGAEAVQLTPDKLKAAWEGPQREQINRIVQAIKAALPTATIEETGDSASMAYGAGGTVAFIREHGAWKIKDF